MPRHSFTIAALSLFTTFFLPEAAAQGCTGVQSRFTPKIGAGYRAHALITGLRSPRHITFDSEGNLLVAEAGAGAVQRLILEESGENVCVASKTVLTSDRSTNHGIALSADGKTLFTSNLQAVTSYPYDPVAGTLGTAKVLINGMANAGTHPTRAITTSKLNPDILIVARGANNNIDTTTVNQASGRGMIKIFSIAEISATPVPFDTSGEIIAWGLRNIVGVGEHPLNGGIWSVENSMDDIRVSGRDVHNDNPAEKLNYHGILNNTADPVRGLNFGYPSCIPAWNPELLGIQGLQVGDLFSPDNTPRVDSCADRQKGTLHFPSHNAPLAIEFSPDATKAYISFHGSWNRNPADGYRLMRVDFKDGMPTASASAKDAAIPVLENQNAATCPNGCFRPVGVAVDKKGRIFVSSDSTGEIWVIYES